MTFQFVVVRVIGDHTLEVDPIVKFGYLTVTTDAKTLTVTFKTAPRGGPVTYIWGVWIGAKQAPSQETKQ